MTTFNSLRKYNAFLKTDHGGQRYLIKYRFDLGIIVILVNTANLFIWQ